MTDWSRPSIERSGPNRSAGGLYRTAEDGRTGLGGIPLIDTEDAVVAAVRLAYRVADAQVDRGARLAQRLRDAGDRAVGSNSERQAVDATERLIFKSMMGALTWLEAAATQDESVLKRVMLVQYRVLGSLLGLGGATQAPPPTPAPPAVSPASAATAADPPTPAVKVVLNGDNKRPVRVCSLDVAVGARPSANLGFYCVGDTSAEPLAGRFTVTASGASLAVTPTQQAPSGRWKAAVCDAHDVQIGVIEIEL